MKDIEDFIIPPITSSGIFPFEDLRLFLVQVVEEEEEEEVVVVVVLPSAAVVEEVVALQSVVVELEVARKSY
jgi:hypothetical protein